MGPRRTYVVSLYEGDHSIVVEAVQRDERTRLDDLDELPERIRKWEDEELLQAPAKDGGGSGDGN